MSQHVGPADDEGIQLTYSSLPPPSPGSRLYTLPAAILHHGRLALEEPGGPAPVRTSRDAWPRHYHHLLTAGFLCALFAVGVLLGSVVSGYAASVRSLPSSATLLSRPGERTTLATHSGAVGSRAGATADALYAFVTLGIACLRDLCDAPDASLYVPAGQRVYALHGGWSCTTLSGTVVVGRDKQYVYCHLDQPNVFTATFDGAPFDCVGSWLGCHFVVQVEMTNGR
jgi:hypothetical protein